MYLFEFRFPDGNLQLEYLGVEVWATRIVGLFLQTLGRVAMARLWNGKNDLWLHFKKSKTIRFQVSNAVHHRPLVHITYSSIK